ncbi:MAG: hypothetical protein R3D02_10075 [Hyphomicrobiales bacterium]
MIGRVVRNGLAAAAFAAVAAVAVWPALAGDVPVPAPAKGKGEACVADTAFMRRNHMTMLKHQRDETMHEGIRTKQFSLKECIACHEVSGPDAKPVTIESPDHFCRSCHDYAAVSIDCFECHASTPGGADKSADVGGHDAVAQLSAYAKGLK